MSQNISCFLEGILNVSHKLCGRSLAPLSFIHVLILKHLGNPLVVGNAPLSINHLIQAANVCSAETFSEITKKAGYVRPIEYFQAKPLGWFRYDLGEEVAAWNSYYSDYVNIPRLREAETAGDFSATKQEPIAWEIRSIANLIKITGWDFEKVAFLGLGQAVYLNLTFGFLESGETQIMSDSEAAIYDLIEGGRV